MSKHYPSIIFIGLTLVLGIIYAQLHSEGKDASIGQVSIPKHTPSPQLAGSAEQQLFDKNNADLPAFSELELQALKGIVWQVKASFTLEKKLEGCGFVKLSKHNPIHAKHSYFQFGDANLVYVFTPKQKHLKDTLKAHLHGMSCLYHDGIEALDIVTKVRLDENTFPSDVGKGLPLGLIFGLDKEQGVVRTKGGFRLGIPDLELHGNQSDAERLAWHFLERSISVDEQSKSANLNDQYIFSVTEKNDHLIKVSLSAKTKKSSAEPALKARRVFNHDSVRRKSQPKKTKVKAPTKMPSYR